MFGKPSHEADKEQAVKNFRFEIQNNELIIRVKLDEDYGFSKSGRSRMIASTEGNLRLFDANGFRSEVVNLNVTRKVSKEDDKSY